MTLSTLCIFPSICGLNAVSTGSIHIEISRSPRSSCTGTQTQYRLEPVMEFAKLSVRLRISPSFRETNQSSSRRNKSRQVKFNWSRGGLYSGCIDSHSLVFVCVPRERAGARGRLVLGSPIAEFQAVAATWRFWFLYFAFHIY